MIVFLDKLQERGLDSQEVGELLSIKDKKKEGVKMSAPNIEDERETARENEQETFLRSIWEWTNKFNTAMENEDYEEAAQLVRIINDDTHNYLYHESNNFSELIERD